MTIEFLHAWWFGPALSIALLFSGFWAVRGMIIAEKARRYFSRAVYAIIIMALFCLAVAAMLFTGAWLFAPVFYILGALVGFFRTMRCEPPTA